MLHHHVYYMVADKALHPTIYYLAVHYLRIVVGMCGWLHSTHVLQYVPAHFCVFVGFLDLVALFLVHHVHKNGLRLDTEG